MAIFAAAMVVSRGDIFSTGYSATVTNGGKTLYRGRQVLERPYETYLQGLQNIRLITLDSIQRQIISRRLWLCTRVHNQGY